MHTKERLLADMKAGNSVTIGGHTYHGENPRGFDEAYDEAKAKEDEAKPQTLAAATAELRQFDGVSRAEHDLLQSRVATDYVPKAEHEALQASIAADYVKKSDADALATRNGQQADLLDALTAPERLAAMDEATLGKVAAFVGAKPGRNSDETLKAIAAKRGA